MRFLLVLVLALGGCCPPAHTYRDHEWHYSVVKDDQGEDWLVFFGADGVPQVRILKRLID
jgi:hypothetical protein